MEGLSLNVEIILLQKILCEDALGRLVLHSEEKNLLDLVHLKTHNTDKGSPALGSAALSGNKTWLQQESAPLLVPARTALCHHCKSPATPGHLGMPLVSWLIKCCFLFLLNKLTRHQLPLGRQPSCSQAEETYGTGGREGHGSAGSRAESREQRQHGLSLDLWISSLRFW